MPPEITIRNLAPYAVALVPVQSPEGHKVYKVPPGARISVSIDGQVLQGNETLAGKPIKLVRKGRQLQVRTDDEVLLELESDEATGAALEGSHWPQALELPADAAQMAGTGTQGDIADAIFPLPTPGAVIGVTGLVGVALTGSSDPSKETNTTTVSGSVVAGPVLAGHGLSVKLYAANGSTLLGTAKVDASGKFKADLGNYTGVVIARLVDADGGNDYWDEASAQPKDLNAAFTAVGVAQAGKPLALNINALTTAAAIAAGLQPDGSVGSPLSQANVQRSNAAMAQSVGLSDILADGIVATVSASGQPNPAANLYGKILAALSGVDGANGGDSQATITDLANALDTATGSLSEEGVAALVVGAANAGLDVSEVAEAVDPDATVVPAAASLSAEGQTLFKAALAAKPASDVATAAQVQALAAAVQNVMDGDASLADLQLLGITGVTVDNLAAVQAALAAADDATELTSIAKLQFVASIGGTNAADAALDVAQAELDAAQAALTAALAQLPASGSSTLATGPSCKRWRPPKPPWPPRPQPPPLRPTPRRPPSLQPMRQPPLLARASPTSRPSPTPLRPPLPMPPPWPPPPPPANRPPTPKWPSTSPPPTPQALPSPPRKATWTRPRRPWPALCRR